MNALNSTEIPLSDQTEFRLNGLNKIKDYFNSETQERKAMIILLLIILTRL